MREGRLNLLPSLFSVYNDNECDETSHLLAKYLLENFDRLDELTVNDLMDAAFVSRSGVRRFCQSIGFGNFSEVRDAFVEWEMFRQYYLSYSLLYSDVKLHLREDLSQMFSDIDRLMTPATTQKLCNDFHEARHVVLLTSDSSSASLINFQRAMTMLKRLVQMVTESAPTTQTVRSLTSEDLLVVVSASGSFAHAQHEQIEASGAKKVFITAAEGARTGEGGLYDGYDQVLAIKPPIVRQSPKHVLYATYGMEYLFDQIQVAYARLFDVTLGNIDIVW
ncbi:MAG: MurR/RpiR family transcriptional regulator [Atopobiaceae bacterium]|nr:MurR/RpiR family transcriptional regulator [Muricaecibacterium torontonense]MCI8675293.1 MurR/RpiR family transcriptional regulator [Atopobiaceae bacterium]